MIQRKKSVDTQFFLHTQGYNFFNCNKLTIDEINRLIEGFNSDVSKKNKVAKKPKRKRR